ncbi:ATP-binding protein [Paenibacillus rigui]|uniref:Circadian input-output histidine kinase CikA n=1 Tax=Paenibacillus rigui TaxID=554312 RepID=A0A229UHY5_9BACL|nr:ATP-binding protein [Paenibacillus rigui]OXM82990.1 histidine kinase [Paenibacillus rigui]
MRKNAAALLTIICTLMIFFSVYEGVSIRRAVANHPVAERGVMDLTGWDFAASGIAPLNGEWEYYRNQLLVPDDFNPDKRGGKLPEMTAYVHVPDIWDRYLGQEDAAHGYATFRLRVKLEEGNGRIYGIRPLNIKTAHKLYVNGREIGGRGIPGLNSQGTVSVNAPYARFFALEGSSAEIVVQVANYRYADGGITHPIFLGYQEDIQFSRETAVSIDLIAVSGFVLIGTYFLVLYRMRRRERSWLYFGLCCVSVGMYVATHGEKIVAIVLPELDFELMLKIQTLSGAFVELFLLLYTMRSFPNLFKKIAMQGFGAILTVRILFTLLTPASVFSQADFLVFALSLAEILYVVYVMAAGAVRRMEGASYMLIGALSLLILDVVTTLDIILSVSVYSIQVVAWISFALAQMLLLSKRFIRAFSAVEQLSKRLHSLDRFKDEFLANTSHEMKTPLHGIINIAQSLIEGAAGRLTPQQEENVALIASTGKRMANLVGDLLDFSKLKNGELILKRRAVALRPVVQVIMEMFRHLSGNKPVRFIELLNNRQFVYMDEDRLVQILNNLIGNALKFTAAGEITVSAREENGWLAISVADTGIGIPPGKLEVIFEAFEQTGSAMAREFGGTGLGLSITKRLVELHGGIIRAESGPGKGAVFTFTAPLAREGDDQLAGAEIAAASEPTMMLDRPPAASDTFRLEGDKTFTVLVADDDAANRQVLINLLSVEKYTVIAVSHGQEAMRQLDLNRRIDLAVIDLMMPGMSGYEVCRNIRNRYSLSELPVLLLTARNRPEDILTAFDAGVNDFLGKPVEAGELKARIRTLLEMKKSVGKLINAEMAFLQAQIKPHFLFNTLNTVISVSYTDVGKAQELLGELGQYLRSSFDFQNLEHLVSIRKELELVESYLIIEQARFGPRLQVIYDIDEQIRVPIPPLVIQPIVENAVRHGVTKRPEGGTVRISAKSGQDGIVVLVEDDGPGFSLESKMAGTKERTGGVGLANIERRMRTLYGTGLEIDSTPGQGTKVTIRVPNSIK